VAKLVGTVFVEVPLKPGNTKSVEVPRDESPCPVLACVELAADASALGKEGVLDPSPVRGQKTSEHEPPANLGLSLNGA